VERLTFLAGALTRFETNTMAKKFDMGVFGEECEDAWRMKSHKDATEDLRLLTGVSLFSGGGIGDLALHASGVAAPLVFSTGFWAR
jgi:hypothetical protein